MERRCACCGRYIDTGQRGTRVYCDDNEECKQKRKRERQRKRMRDDVAYRENQKAAYKKWSESHPDYWRNYRADHDEYTERNRQQQRKRNEKRRQQRCAGSVCNKAEPIAKMETKQLQAAEKPRIKPGRYQLQPLGDGIAKMDAITVEIAVIT
jgi:hypothetical protein